MLDTEDYESYEMRDKVLMDESISNYTSVSYNNKKKTNKYIKKLSNKIFIIYIT